MAGQAAAHWLSFAGDSCQCFKTVAVDLPARPRCVVLPLWLVAEGGLEEWLAAAPAAVAWVRAPVRRERIACCCCPNGRRRIAGAVAGARRARDPSTSSRPWHAAGWPDRLPPGTWRWRSRWPLRRTRA
jgi:hypothetical protein